MSSVGGGSTVEMGSLTSGEVVFCPYQGAGHVNPALVFAEKLGTRYAIRSRILLGGRHLYNGLPSEYKSGGSKVLSGMITIEVLEIGDEEKSKSHSLRQVSNGVRNIQTHDLGKPFDNHAEQVCLRIKELSQSDSPPLCVLLDICHLCSSKISSWVSDLKPLRICLFSALSAGSLVCMLGGMENLFTWDAEKMQLVIPDLPPLLLRDFQSHPEMNQMGDNMKHQAKLFDTIILNTCEELEAGALTTLRKHFNSSFARDVYALGPLLEDPFSHGVDADNLYKKWLDLQPPASVLFICFGSWIQLSELQIQELAAGLERSKHRFLWVIPSDDQAATLPEGFNERTSGRGMVAVGWAPQKFILSHESTGAFVTVCGWNSILECASLGGVPMLCWPIFGDQLTNCRFVVDGLKIGVEVIGDGDATGLVRRDEVEAAVRSVMEDEGLQLRSKSLKKALQVTQGKNPEVFYNFVSAITSSKR